MFIDRELVSSVATGQLVLLLDVGEKSLVDTRRVFIFGHTFRLLFLYTQSLCGLGTRREGFSLFGGLAGKPQNWPEIPFRIGFTSHSNEFNGSSSSVSGGDWQLKNSLSVGCEWEMQIIYYFPLNEARAGASQPAMNHRGGEAPQLEFCLRKVLPAALQSTSI